MNQKKMTLDSKLKIGKQNGNMMIKIGITSQKGFIGNHLYNTLSLDEDVNLINFDRHWKLPLQCIYYLSYGAI